MRQCKVVTLLLTAGTIAREMAWADDAGSQTRASARRGDGEETQWSLSPSTILHLLGDRGRGSKSLLLWVLWSQSCHANVLSLFQVLLKANAPWKKKRCLGVLFRTVYWHHF